MANAEKNQARGGLVKLPRTPHDISAPAGRAAGLETSLVYGISKKARTDRQTTGRRFTEQMVSMCGQTTWLSAAPAT